MEMMIRLPETLKDFVESEASTGGFASVDDYIQALVRQVQKSKTRRKVESLLDEGLNTECADWNASTLENAKKEVHKRHQAVGNGESKVSQHSLLSS